MDEDLDFNVEVALSEIVKELKIPVIILNNNKSKEENNESSNEL